MKTLIFALTLTASLNAQSGFIEMDEPSISLQSEPETTPPQEIVKAAENAQEDCRTRFNALKRCRDGVYLIGSIGASAGGMSLPSGAGWVQIHFPRIEAGISILDTVEAGVQAGNVTFPLVFMTWTYGTYAKIRPISWLYVKGGFYRLTLPSDTEFDYYNGRFVQGEIGINANKIFKNAEFPDSVDFGLTVDRAPIGTTMVGASLKINGALKLFRLRKN